METKNKDCKTSEICFEILDKDNSIKTICYPLEKINIKYADLTGANGTGQTA